MGDCWNTILYVDDGDMIPYTRPIEEGFYVCYRRDEILIVHITPSDSPYATIVSSLVVVSNEPYRLAQNEYEEIFGNTMTWETLTHYYMFKLTEEEVLKHVIMENV